MTTAIQRTYSIQKVLELRQRIISAPTLWSYRNRRLDGSLFVPFTEDLTRLLPGGIQRDVVRDSVRNLAGNMLTDQVLADTAWRIAGNIPRLKAMRAAPPWNRQVTDEYVPVQVVGAKPGRRNHRDFVQMSLQTLAGTSCPMLLQKSWSRPLCQAISQRLGFSKPWKPLPFNDVRQLAGLRFYVLIEAARSGVRPEFDTLWYSNDGKKIRPSGCYEHNQQLIKMRARLPGVYECPRDFPAQMPCHTCIVGLDACPVAVHSATFERRQCPACRTVNWFDPADLGTRFCIACTGIAESHS